MIQSMTGYGKAVRESRGKKITVEVKSLNSKTLDLNVRLPQAFRELELALRERIGQTLQRGKVDLFINTETTGAEESTALNEPVILAYLSQLEQIKYKAEIKGDSLAAVMRLPDVLHSGNDELSDADRQATLDALNEALQKLNDYRTEEGKSLENDLLERLRLISGFLSEVETFEAERLPAVRERLLKQLEELRNGHDSNRLEQELIYYLEKLDINEEKVRLRAHLEYFRQAMKEEAPGKKLGFIAQEIGREINTIGSKSNHAGMQRAVVRMKDELEKIKEQVNNAL